MLSSVSNLLERGRDNACNFGHFNGSAILFNASIDPYRKVRNYREPFVFKNIPARSHPTCECLALDRSEFQAPTASRLQVENTIKSQDPVDDRIKATNQFGNQYRDM